MVRLLSLLFLLLVLGFAPAPPVRHSRSAIDLKKMQGSWKLAERQGGWWMTGRIGVGEPTIVIRGNQLACGGESAPRRCLMTLDATRTPRRYVEHPVGTTLHLECRGIYEMQGNSLRFSCNDVGEDPPEAFEGPRRGKFLALYERIKP